MNCKKCGTPISNGDIFCKGCGMPVNSFNQGNTVINTNTESDQFSKTEVLDLDGINAANASQPSSPVGVPMGGYSEQPPSPIETSVTESFEQPRPAQAPFGGSFGQAYQAPFGPQRPIMNNNQMYNNYNAPVANKSKNNVIIPIAISVFIVIVAAVVILGFMNNKIFNGSGNITGYKVNYSDYTFTIPEDYQYEITTDTLMITDESESWVAEIGVIDGAYVNLKTNADRVKTNLENGGFVSKDAVEKTFGGKTFLTFEVSNGGTNGIIAYTKASATSLFGLATYNVDNIVDYSIFDKIVPILSNSVYNNGGTNIGTSKFNSDLLKEIVE
jgi:hypothetical protein